MKYIVNEPVIDLRRSPYPHPGSYEKDLIQETQLLYGETVLAEREEGEWVKIGALEQFKHSEQQWIPYPGWVLRKQITPVTQFPSQDLVIHSLWANIYLKPSLSAPIFNSLSFGTKLQVVEDQKDWWGVRLYNLNLDLGWIPKSDARLISGIKSKSLESRRLESIGLGQMMLQAPYLWGGRSAYRPDWKHQITSVDCAALVNLLYRVCHGMDIPRDSHDQYLKANPCDPGTLQIGDLVFLSSKDSQKSRISHVMLYAGGDALLESTMQTKSVQLTSFKEKLGKPLVEIPQGGDTEKFNVYFGALDFTGNF